MWWRLGDNQDNVDDNANIHSKLKDPKHFEGPQDIFDNREDENPLRIQKHFFWQLAGWQKLSKMASAEDFRLEQKC